MYFHIKYRIQIITSLVYFGLCIISISQLYAQNIGNGWSYGGVGRQRCFGTYIDPIGNRYEVIGIYGGNCTIDSLGVPIQIATGVKDPEALVIVKFDQSGKYLFHLRLEDMRGYPPNQLCIQFNSQNEAYLSYIFSPEDTISVYSKNDILFQKVIPQFNRQFYNKSINNDALLYLFKIAVNGDIVWSQTISWQNMSTTTAGSGYKNAQIIVSQNDELTIPFFKNINKSNSKVDTITLVDLQNKITYLPVHAGRILLRFDKNGNIIRAIDFFKNKLKTNINDTNLFPFYYTAVTDLRNLYLIVGVNIQVVDTLKLASPIYLKQGTHILLMKLNGLDSIEWINDLGSIQSVSNNTSAFVAKLIYDSARDELATGATFIPNQFAFSHTNLYSSFRTDNEILMTRWSLLGNRKWEQLYTGSQNDELANITYFDDGRIGMIGSTKSSDLQFESFIVPNTSTGLSSSFYISFLDSLNHISSLQSFKSSSNSNNWGARFYTQNTFESSIGSPISDKTGNYYISGYLGDTLTFKCKMVGAYYDTDINGARNSDAFVLKFFIPKVIIKTTCLPIASPSGKYIWNSPGYFYDTIANIIGCDSILKFHLIRGQYFIKLDSQVCSSMLSYSKKYIWKNTGNYFDTIPSKNGCDSVIQTQLTILKDSSSITIHSKDNYTSPSGKFKWYTSGIYIDTVQNFRGCDSIITINLTLNDGLNVLTMSNFILYPNPFTDQVKFKSLLGVPIKVEVFDISGRVMQSTQTDLSEGFIDVSYLEKGFYFFKLSNANFCGIYKLQKK